MRLDGAVIVAIAADAETRDSRVQSLRAEGATVASCVVNTDVLAVLSGLEIDAMLLDVGDAPERFTATSGVLRSEPRTMGLNVVLAADPSLEVSRLLLLGPARVVPSRPDEALIAALVEIVDTHRRLVANPLRHARAAFEHIAALRRDLATFSHDARVLVGIIGGFAANLRDEIAGPLSEMQRTHVAQIMETTGDTIALLDRYVVGAKAHTAIGEQPVLVAPAPALGGRTLQDLAALVRSTAHPFERMAAQKELKIDIVSEDPPPKLWCDALQVKQVVINLLVNAIKFTPRGGTVSIIVRTQAPVGPKAPDAPPPKANAELIVSDTGPGIAATDRERVFERGVRLERDAELSGAGLGLSVVRDVMSRHRGEVRIDEAEGGGAKFIVHLPLDLRSRPRDSSDGGARPAGGRG